MGLDHPDPHKNIVQTRRRMRTSGLAAGTGGNVSARAPEGDASITPGGLDLAVTEPEDAVVVSLDGQALEGAFEPSA